MIWILGRQINLATNEDDEDDKFEDDEDDEDTWSASESRNWAVFRQRLDSTVGAPLVLLSGEIDYYFYIFLIFFIIFIFDSTVGSPPVLLSGEDDDQPWCP